MKPKVKKKAWQEYSMTKERFGYTLSQNLAIGAIIFLVLFTLLAVPFYNSCMQKQTIAKLRTLHATLLQAKRTYDLDHEERGDLYDTGLEPEAFANEYFIPYLKTEKTCNEKNAKDCWKNLIYKDLKNRPQINKSSFSVVLNDRSIIGFVKNNSMMSIIIDTNNVAGPNKLGRDIFLMYFYNTQNLPTLCPKETYTKYAITDGIHLGGYDECAIPFDVKPYEELYSQHQEDGCNKKSPKNINGFGSGAACAAVIKQNEWHIDKKYPW